MENIKKINIHIPTHIKPLTDEDFGHYLAGLIDGDGNFSYRQCTLVFNILDSSSAFYIKKRLQFGTVTKIPSKNAIKLVISKKEGLEKIVNLVNGKLRVPFKLECIKKHLLHSYLTPFNLKKNLSLNTSTDLNNYWLAGFIDADGSFQIKIVVRKKRMVPEVRLNLQIDQKTCDLLFLIQKQFGGNIGYRSSQDTYYYGSTSFGVAKTFINYFDKYHLLSTKYLNYCMWRKVYIYVQEKKHLTCEGLAKIRQLKKSMNRNLKLSENIV